MVNNWNILQEIVQLGNDLISQTGQFGFILLPGFVLSVPISIHHMITRSILISYDPNRFEDMPTKTVLYTLVELIITFSFFFSGNKFPMPIHHFTAAPLPGWNWTKLFFLGHPNLWPLTGQLSDQTSKAAAWDLVVGCGLLMIAGRTPNQSLVGRIPGKVTRTNDYT